jgi:uncharacterized protein YndB with AHSA1/START domain
MDELVETGTIPRPLEEVFDAAADPFQQLQWDAKLLKSVQPVGSGPLAKGARYRGRFKGMGTVEYEYADYDPPHRFAHRSALPMGEMLHTLEFEPVDGGTRLTQRISMRPTFLGRVMGPVMRPRMRRRMRDLPLQLTEYLQAKRTPR